MSRFFQGGISDSDYSSSEEELLSSSSEEEELNSSDEDQDDLSSDSEFVDDNDESDHSDIDDDVGRIRGPSYFLKKNHGKDLSDDESSDDDKKIVKSAKEKLFDELEDSISVINNSSVLNDWVSVLSEFDKANRLLVRAKQHGISTPTIYIKSLSSLDETVQKLFNEDKDALKKLNPVVFRAFNTIKQRVKKSIRDNLELVESYRNSPETFAKSQAHSSSDLSLPSQDATASKSSSSSSAPIFKTLRAVAESRGKKNVDIPEQIKALEESIGTVSSTYEHIVIYLMLIPLRFDSATNSTLWSAEHWKSTTQDVNNFFDILEKNISSYRVLETAEPSDDIEIEPTPNAEGVREILGSVVSFVERLDDEFTRSLQVIDPYTTEYIDRLRDEQLMYNTIVRAQLYSENVVPKETFNKSLPSSSTSKISSAVSTARDQIARIVTRRMEHIYFKSKKLINVIEAKTWKDANITKQTSQIIPYSESSDDYPDKLLDSLASILYQQPNAIYRKRAMLSHIYYYAYNNKYQKARNMFLVSHLQSTIHTSELGLQMLFNRALVQLGLCAFRNGMIQDSHQALQEIATSQRHKELLGQSGQRFTQSTVVDKQRLLPFHMHINLELLESVFLTSSLLIEIPQYAQLGSSIDARKRLQNKSFRRTLEFHEKQIFQGPPESTKDHIMHAAKALQAGNWRNSVKLLTSIKIWDQFPESDKIRASIKEKVQVEGLRTYLFQFKSFYSKLSISKLAQIFELPESQVSAVVTKMIFNEDISGGLDQISNSIIFNKGVELTKLQELALTLADSASVLTERNERLAGSRQLQGNERNSYSSGNGNHHQNRHHNRSANVKFAPVTGALSSAPGTISGALNGMNKRNTRTARA